MNFPTSDERAWSDHSHLTTEVLRLPGEANKLHALVCRLVKELAASWRQGEPRVVEDYLNEHPELRGHPQAAARLAYEEFCLRQEMNQEIPEDEFLGRFPQWVEELRILLDGQRLFETAPGELVFPTAGDLWGDFQLLAELGRGSQGRVFLATQPALADRAVVVKLSACRGREHLSLARLQHTGIVPLYFVQDDPAHNFRTLCMPFFGGLTLAQLLKCLRRIPLRERTGALILQALDEAQQAAPAQLPHKEPSRLVLANISYVQAVCWVGLCLAEALHYAHERGLVHLDVKPSNVLLTADGQPMLLDFHLAQPPIRPGETAPEWIGGTLTYMPREQQAAMVALNGGRPITTVVDGRADLYALGVLLYEALGGNLPLLPGVSPPLHRVNPQVSVGLSDVIARCLEYHPRDRYPDAAALAADLRRHLKHQKLRGVRNRSWRERWAKWRQRSPAALWLTALVIVALVASSTAGYLAWAGRKQLQHAAAERRARAAKALDRGYKALTNNDYQRSVASLQHGLELVKDDADAQELCHQVNQQLLLAKRALAAHDLEKHADQIHERMEEIRYVYGSENLPIGVVCKLEADCRSGWVKRSQILHRSALELPAQIDQRIRTDWFDLAIILSDLEVRLASDQGGRLARRRALKVLDEAESLFGPSAVLERERQARAEELGDRDLAQRSARRASRLQPRTAWEYCLVARLWMRSKKWSQAKAELRKALELEPQSFWANYYEGESAFQSQHFQEAVNAFRVCIALKPRSAACFFNRARAHEALKQTRNALRDYRHALSKGMDAKGMEPAAAYYHMALLHLQTKDRSAARQCLQQALHHDPCHRDALVLSQRLKS